MLYIAAVNHTNFPFICISPTPGHPDSPSPQHTPQTLVEVTAAMKDVSVTVVVNLTGILQHREENHPLKRSIHLCGL